MDGYACQKHINSHTHTQKGSTLPEVKLEKVSQVLTEAGWSFLLIAAAH